ncbi:Serine/threonine-protein phosphatase 2A activator 1 [Pestalotiopsis fici W106-1]|uniref:Serine/threonine-protein phosphatase 2A activator n=1 Tax=Pestalotiopsis fici (strain W106-1 / CGMCC3.15140) TaxID=1229662 RepID=W3WW71_PESFW|nr:Serine/threonine-protein phosphatase 2A activator 1 [Pestalotiopsis fici W106-1]ETS78100.1 Serine/threonine-protein phosphatase 2A activator 1 [Pestalotiopsis fici W106-1]
MEPSPNPTFNAKSPFVTLEVLDPSTIHAFVSPTKEINDGPDVSRFLVSKAYRDIGIFVLQLNRAMCPRKSKGSDGKEKVQTFEIGSKLETQPAKSVQSIQQLLFKLESFIDEAPPDKGPRRFGNVSFRKWYKILDERASSLLEECLPQSILKFGSSPGQNGVTAEEELKAYLLGAFGSPQRLDYGTGHELSFLAFLIGLWKLGAFKDGQQDGEIERNIVLGAFEPYLRVVRKLILTYTLEPAGSHGVWGLDDHSFQPYIYGSAQLTRPIGDNEEMPMEGSRFGAPRLDAVSKADKVQDYRETNMYFSAVGFIYDVKTGPFGEHSSVLHSLSQVKLGWGKINSGMLKMFNGEVLSKFPVVQHLPFGSLLSWERDPDAKEPQQSVHMVNQPIASAALKSNNSGTSAGTAAPWAKPGNMPPPMQAPWASGVPTTRPPPTQATSVNPSIRTPFPASQPLPRPTAPAAGSTDAQITVTKAPWAKD